MPSTMNKNTSPKKEEIQEILKDSSLEASILSRLTYLIQDLFHEKVYQFFQQPGNSASAEDSILMSEKVEKTFSAPIFKTDEEKRLVTGVVLHNEVDAHGDQFDDDVIEEAALEFMEKHQTIGIQHKAKTEQVSIVESFIVRETFDLGDQQITKGSWVMTVKVHSDTLWDAIKAGEFTGFSIGGFAERIRDA